jgi:hypothetical protein
MITDFNFTMTVLPFPDGESTGVTLYALDDRPEARVSPWDVHGAEQWQKRNGLPGWADPDSVRAMYDLEHPSDHLLPSARRAPSQTIQPVPQSSDVHEQEKDLTGSPGFNPDAYRAKRPS